MSTPIPSTDLVTVRVEQEPRMRDERGMTTAEYAVGTVAAASFAGVLIKILTDPTLQELILNLIRLLLQTFMQVSGN